MDFYRYFQLLLYIFDSSKYPPFARTTAAHTLGILLISLPNVSVESRFQEVCKNSQSWFELVAFFLLLCSIRPIKIQWGYSQETEEAIPYILVVSAFLWLVYNSGKFGRVFRIVILLENESSTHNYFPAWKIVSLDHCSTVQSLCFFAQFNLLTLFCFRRSVFWLQYILFSRNHADVAVP